MWFPKKRSLSLSDIDKICVDLALKTISFKPEVVVSIKTGGWYVGKRISKCLNIPHYSITIRRENGQYAHRRCLKIAKIILIIRRILNTGAIPIVIKGLDKSTPSLKGKKVLIVDDAIHTGKTLIVAYQYLESLQVSQMKSAVIGNVQSRYVDYCMYKGYYCYPWSRISSQYNKFLAIYKTKTKFSHI